MYLKMVITNEKKEVLKTEEMKINSGGLNRVVAPQLFGMALYQLKKNKAVEIKCEDGSIMYTLSEFKTEEEKPADEIKN